MPISDKQLAANRANAAKSTGPKPRYGLQIKDILVTGESRDRFLKLLASLEAEFQPETDTEHGLVETMAVARWRTTRLWAVEAAGIVHEQRRLEDAGLADNLDPPTRTMLAIRSLGDRTRHPDTLRRDEISYDRQFHRAVNCFFRLRAEKKSERSQSRQLDENKESGL